MYHLMLCTRQLPRRPYRAYCYLTDRRARALKRTTATASGQKQPPTKDRLGQKLPPEDIQESEKPQLDHATDYFRTPSTNP